MYASLALSDGMQYQILTCGTSGIAFSALIPVMFEDCVVRGMHFSIAYNTHN